MYQIHPTYYKIKCIYETNENSYLSLMKLEYILMKFKRAPTVCCNHNDRQPLFWIVAALVKSLSDILND